MFLAINRMVNNLAEADGVWIFTKVYKKNLQIYTRPQKQLKLCNRDVWMKRSIRLTKDIYLIYFNAKRKFWIFPPCLTSIINIKVLGFEYTLTVSKHSAGVLLFNRRHVLFSCFKLIKWFALLSLTADVERFKTNEKTISGFLHLNWYQHTNLVDITNLLDITSEFFQHCG